MMPDNTIQYEMWFTRAYSLINDWQEHLAGDQEVQQAFPLEYLAANLVEQIKRIERLNLSDKRFDDLSDRFSSLLDTWRSKLILNSLKGAEPDSLSSLFGNVLDSIEAALRLEEKPELEFDLHDQITDCLVRRDDLYLIENFVRSEMIYLNDDSRGRAVNLLEKHLLAVAKIDKEFKENIDVFALTSQFCSHYVKTNNINDENTYWWLFEPIRRADETQIVSLLSLKSLLPRVASDENIIDLTAHLNARVWQKRLEFEESPKEHGKESEPARILDLHPQEPLGEPSYAEESKHDYALVARVRDDQALEPAIYALMINIRKRVPEHYKTVGLTGSDFKSAKYLDQDTQKVLEEIPTIAEGIFGLPRQDFTLSLAATSEGCTGRSIGLAALLEYLRSVRFISISLPVAATGVLDLDGTVRRVEDINEKVQHALKAGFSIVLVPEANKDDLKQDLKSTTLRFVSNIKEAYNTLKIKGQVQLDARTDKPFDELNRIKVKLNAEGLETTEIEAKDWQYYIEVSGLGDKARVVVYYDKSGFPKRPQIQGRSDSPLTKRLTELILHSAEPLPQLPSSGRQIRAKAVILQPETRIRIREYLCHNFGNELQEIQEKACDYRLDIIREGKIIVKQYPNGTLTLEGREGTLWDQVVSAVVTVSGVRPEVYLAEPQKGEEKHSEQDILPPDVTSWTGIDEAGKGDYFGPLVTAAVLVDASNRQKLSQLGIKDSKDLSDQKNIELGLQILEICQDKCYVLTTMPEKYNQLMAEPSFQGNSQRLLGWQHRRALENILSKHDCQYAICDKFGSDFFINEGLKTGKGTQIKIIQRTKAEADLAVAAASILARREFLLRIQKMSQEYGTMFPKGSMDYEAISKVAHTLIKNFGKDALGKVAKLHFKTTKRILSDTLR
jgi:ribonuclease HIII